MEEIWKEIPELNGKYFASNLGRIKSSTRQGEKIRKLSINPKGYFCFSIYFNGKSKSLRVHKCVAQAFLGKCPDGLMVNHKDGMPLNNKIENLEFVSRRENMCHSSMMKNKLVGAYRNRQGKYHAAIKVNKRRIIIGLYETAAQANAAYIKYCQDNNISNKYAEAQAQKGKECK